MNIDDLRPGSIHDGVLIEPSPGLAPAKRNLFWAANVALLLGLSQSALPPTGPVLIYLPVLGSNAAIDKGAISLGASLYLIYLWVRFRHEVKLTIRRNSERGRKLNSPAADDVFRDIIEEAMNVQEGLRSYATALRVASDTKEKLPALADEIRSQAQDLLARLDIVPGARGRLMDDDLQFPLDTLSEWVESAHDLDERAKQKVRTYIERHGKVLDNLRQSMAELRIGLSKLANQPDPWPLEPEIRRIEQLQASATRSVREFEELAADINGQDARILKYHDRWATHILCFVALVLCAGGNFPAIVRTIDNVPTAIDLWWERTISAFNPAEPT